MMTEIVMRECGLYGEYSLEFRWIDSPHFVACKATFDPEKVTVAELYKISEDARKHSEEARKEN